MASVPVWPNDGKVRELHCHVLVLMDTLHDSQMEQVAVFVMRTM